MKMAKISVETAKQLLDDDPKIVVLDGRYTSSLNCMPEYKGDFTGIHTIWFVAEMEDNYDYMVVS